VTTRSLYDGEQVIEEYEDGALVRTFVCPHVFESKVASS